MNPSQKHIIFKIGGSILLILVCLIALVSFHFNKADAYSSYEQAQGEANAAQTMLDVKQGHILANVYKNLQYSKNPKLHAYGVNQSRMSMIDQPINQLLRTSYTWNNESDYLSIPSKLTSVATPKALKTKALYKPDKDRSGQSIIKNLSLHKAYVSSNITIKSIHKNNINALVSTDYQGWSDSDDGGEKQKTAPTGRQFLLITYNTKMHKISNIQILYTDTNIDG